MVTASDESFFTCKPALLQTPWQVGLPFEGDWPRGRGWLLMPAAGCERSRGGGDCTGPGEIFGGIFSLKSC